MDNFLDHNIIKNSLPRYKYRSHILRKRCYLCGIELTESIINSEREHVIPRVLFSPKNLKNPLILSACTKCNKQKGHDEEYVARHIQVSSTESSPIAGEIFNRVLDKHFRKQSKIITNRKLQYAEGTGIIGKMAKTVKGIDMYTDGGIYLGEYGQLPIDSARFNDFYIRIAKGFFTAAAGQIFDWDNWKIGVKWDMFSAKKYITTEQFLFPYIHGNYQEDWGSSFGLAGFTYTKKDGQLVSYWSIGIFNEQRCIVTFIPKSLIA